MKKLETLNLMEMTALDVEAYLKRDDIVLIPTGSNERHGRHLPLGCDSFQALEIASRAAKKEKAVYTGVVWMGYSPHHMRRPGEGTGTITLRGDTYRALYYDIAKSLIYHGFNKLIFVNYHGSNIKVTDEVFRRIRYETGAFVAMYQHSLERQISLIKDLIKKPGDEKETWKTSTWHAAECETSMMMRTNKDYARMEDAVVGIVHAPEFLGEGFEKIDGLNTVEFKGAENIYVPMDHYEFTESATIGDPTTATEKLGEDLYERMAQHLADFIRAVRNIKVTIKNRDWPERAY
jgi:creatinine amidohydrolase